MKMLSLATIALLTSSLSGPVLAADMPVKAAPAPVVTVYDWSGFYAGVHGGWMDHQIDRTHFYPGFRNDYSTSSSDGIFGSHIGVQKQFGNFVLGAEAAINFGFKAMEGKNGPLEAPFAADLAHLNSVQHLFTFGGRLGYAWNRWMLFGTGGLAVAHLRGQYVVNSTGLLVFPGFWGSSRHYGWYAGVGGEYVLIEGQGADVIIGVEYQHFDVERKRSFTESPVGGFDDSFDLQARGDLVRGRLTFKFKPVGFFR
jgi:outer membrane immunogenic protein